MISRDASACRAGSATAARIASYGRQGASITVACLTPWNVIVVLVRGLLRVRRGWVVTSQDPFEAGMIAWLIARLRGARVELQLHGDFFNPAWATEAWHRPLRLMLARSLLRRADGVRVVSKRQRRSLAGIVEDGRIVQVPVAPKAWNIRSESVNWQEIRYNGRLSVEKNLLMLVRAFAAVRKQFPNALLRMRGSGSQQKIIDVEIERVMGRENIDYAHVERSVEILEWSDDASVGRAGIIAVPSGQESWSRLAVEAALAGRAVVMTDVGCAGEVIIDGESGWVVPVGDEAAFTSALRDALSRPDESRRRGDNARRAAERLPNAADLTRSIVAAWEKLARP